MVRMCTRKTLPDVIAGNVHVDVQVHDHDHVYVNDHGS